MHVDDVLTIWLSKMRVWYYDTYIVFLSWMRVSMKAMLLSITDEISLNACHRTL